VTLIVVSASLMLAATAGAATFTVDSTDDAPDAWAGNGACRTASGNCTLRAAVQEANADPGPDTILVPAGRYDLGMCCSFLGLVDVASQLALLDDVTIAGAGARKTIIESSSAPLANSIFVAPKTTTHVVLSGMTLTGGASAGNGGAISNAGAMTLIKMMISDSSAAYAGGGISTSGPVVISDSTIAGNRARTGGGGVAVLSGGSLAATNTTISGNAVSGSMGTGGGISDVNGSVSLTNVTLSGNTTSAAGGGALSGPATLVNTILDSPAATGNCAAGPLGAPASAGHNLADDASCALSGPGDQPSTDARLDALAANSGPTDTQELLPGSPALDAADAAACPAADQRGIPRPLGAGCDIGALEHQPVADLSVKLDDKPDPIPADDDLTYTLTVNNAGPDPAFDSRVHHDLPPGVVLVAVPQNCSVLGGEISCALGALASGARYTASVIVRPETLGALTSIADVTTTSLDPVTSGNVATAATFVLNRLLSHLRNSKGQPIAPQQGRSVVADVVKGVVMVRRPGETQFTALDGADEIPVGSVLDTTKGQVRLTSATDANGNIQSSIFYGGEFSVTQKPGHALVTLKLVGGSFRSCRLSASAKRIVMRRMARDAAAGPVARAARHVSSSASAKERRTDSSAPKRQVWGKTDGKAKYKTQGRYAAATVRGTIWLTQDRCDGTLVRVRRGLVSVRDLKRKRSKLVPAGHKVLVRAPKRKR
jgi:CSLREA domain-containing protein/uncharacterized repeat protein (TIGR01451 family)